MDEYTDFPAVLRSFMARAHRTAGDLTRLTGLSINTLKNWTGGVVQRPRVVSDLLKLGRALGLDAADTNTLLSAAGHPALAILRAQARQAGDPALCTLLDAWPLAAVRESASPAAAPAALPHAPRHQLRAPIADFVGRTREIDQLVRALRRALAEQRGAIISGVQGMGGIGKTELAYAIAHQLSDAFPDAQIVLNLRGSSASPLTPEQTLQAVIHALSPEAKLPDELSPLEQHYRSLLHGARMLILADDARDATQVQGLLPPVGNAVLVTSRQRFSLPGMVTLQLEQLREDEAVALLRAICPRLNELEALQIALSCGYLPLALRISGSILHSTPALSVASYLARLGDERQRLQALRDLDVPQLDVAASLHLSYAQLDAATQRVFRQIGVFVADFATALAQAVVEPSEGVEIEATLQVLLRRNLALYDAERERWRLHDLLRDLARELLEAAGEAEAVWWRYARAAVRIAEETQEQYKVGGAEMLAALARFDAERAHIDAARRWAAARTEMLNGDQLLADSAVATRYIGAIRYDARCERIPHWEGALAAARRLGDQRAEGLLLNNLGLTYMDVGEIRRARSYYEQALTIFRALGDHICEMGVLSNLGMALADLGETQRAMALYEHNLAILRESGCQGDAGTLLCNLGNAYRDLGMAQRAISYYEQALDCFRAVGYRYDEGYTLPNLGKAYIDLGETRHAIDCCEASLTISREMGDQRMESYALSYLGRAQARQGDRARATAIFEQAIALFYTVGDRLGEAECQWQFGLALAQQGQRERALSLLRAAVAYDQRIAHAKAAEHATLLARLEAGEELPPELFQPAGQRAVGADEEPPSDGAQS